jgi:quercetin dioxygenase-like cupin family protein
MNAAESQDGQDVIRIGQMEIRYLVEARDGCQMGCFELRVPPGSNVPPPHSHSANEELLYVLEGTLRHTVGGETRDLQAGESRVTPRGVAHGFSNPHAVTARALVILTPDTIGSQYFRDVSAVVNAGGPPDRMKLMAVMQTYGLAPAVPPATP